MPPLALDALVLAAGFGTRLHPLTRQLPKALLPIYGTPLLDYHLGRLFGPAPRSDGASPAAGSDDICRAARPDELSPAAGSDENPATAGSLPRRAIAQLQVRRVVVNGHHLADQIRAHLAAHPQRGRIAFSHEAQILGTGGAISHAADHLASDPFVVLNSDALLAAPIEEAVRFHTSHGFWATMVLVDSTVWPNVLVAGERVSRILRGERSARALTFTGLHVISRTLIESLPPGRFHDIRDTYENLIASGRLGAFICQANDPAPFLDIGTPESYLDAHRLCAGEAGARLGLGPAGGSPVIPAEGFGFIDPASLRGARCRIAESVILSGARIDSGSRLRRVIAGPGAHLAGEVHDLMVTTLGSREIARTS